MDNNLLTVEFHCHTDYSRDSVNNIDALIRKARQKGLDRLMITDHNTIRGGLAAQKIDPELIIVGEEILTTQGEFLAFFVKEEVPAHLPPLEAIRRLRQQGAFISVSHPFDLSRHGWPLKELLVIAPLVDAIEIFNSRCLDPKINRLAQEFAIQHNLQGTVGSDAHALFEVATATLRLPYFDSPASLGDALTQAEQLTRLSPGWVHLSSSYARLFHRHPEVP
jgi:predicted metal-dependent phosphoesterase TrpH